MAATVLAIASDVLVPDRIGKNIAGTGFDCNVVGRYSNRGGRMRRTSVPLAADL